jgi:excisionase family DNA binding protein
MSRSLENVSLKLSSDSKSVIERKALFEIQIWTTTDVATALDCSKGHIYNLVSLKMIPFHKKGKRGRLYFIPSEILEWIKFGGFR